MLIVNSTIIEDGAQNSGAVIRCESGRPGNHS